MDIWEYYHIPRWVKIGAIVTRRWDEYEDIVKGFGNCRDAVWVIVHYPDGGTDSNYRLDEFLWRYTPKFKKNGEQEIYPWPM